MNGQPQAPSALTTNKQPAQQLDGKSLSKPQMLRPRPALRSQRRKRNQQRKESCCQKATSEKEGASKNQLQPVKAAPAKPPGKGLVTLGMIGGRLLGGASWRGLGRLPIAPLVGRSCGRGIVDLGVFGCAARPAPTAPLGLDYRLGDIPPRALAQQWFGDHNQLAVLLRESTASAAALPTLHDFLSNRNEVLQVNRLFPRVLADGRRVIAVDLTLRQPVLPLRLGDGSEHWIDADGRVLPRLMAGPEQREPMVVHFERGGLAAYSQALGVAADGGAAAKHPGIGQQY